MHSAQLVEAFAEIGEEMEHFHGEHYLERRRMSKVRANGVEQAEIIDHLSTALQTRGLEFQPGHLQGYVLGTQDQLCTRSLVHNVLMESAPIVKTSLVESFLRKYAAVVSGRAFPRKVIIE